MYAGTENAMIEMFIALSTGCACTALVAGILQFVRGATVSMNENVKTKRNRRAVLRGFSATASTAIIFLSAYLWKSHGGDDMTEGNIRGLSIGLAEASVAALLMTWVVLRDSVRAEGFALPNRRVRRTPHRPERRVSAEIRALYD